MPRFGEKKSITKEDYNVHCVKGILSPIYRILIIYILIINENYINLK